MKTTTKEKLSRATNLDELFKIVAENYDLKNATIGILAKPIIMKHIDTFLILVNAREK
jgi:hypothetical protein